MRTIFLAPLLLLGAACVQAEAEESASGNEIAAPDAQGPASDQDPDAAACEAAGGFLDRRGMIQDLICVHPYADAGKACTDNQQCDGKCVTNDMEPGAEDGSIVGQCQADDALFGCYAEVVDGKAVRAICVD